MAPTPSRHKITAAKLVFRPANAKGDQALPQKMGEPSEGKDAEPASERRGHHGLAGGDIRDQHEGQQNQGTQGG